MNCQEINISPLYVKIKNVMKDYYYQHNTHLLNLKQCQCLYIPKVRVIGIKLFFYRSCLFILLTLFSSLNFHYFPVIFKILNVCIELYRLGVNQYFLYVRFQTQNGGHQGRSRFYRRRLVNLCFVFYQQNDQGIRKKSPPPPSSVVIGTFS